MSLTFSFVAVLQLVHGDNLSRPLLGIPAMALLVFTSFIVWRLVRATHAEVRPDLTPDDCWKLGIFYYNPRDPALMVEKRFGIGYTLNFGNRLSWAFVGGAACVCTHCSDLRRAIDLVKNKNGIDSRRSRRL